MLSGYKTYIVAAAAVIGAVAAYATGESSLEAAISVAISAILAATVRNAIPPKA